MKILGGIHMLEVNEPKLVYEFWSTPKECREILSNATAKTVLDVIKDGSLEDKDLYYDPYEDMWGKNIKVDKFGLNVWVCDNSYQISSLTRGSKEELEGTDTNVCGDASPQETLWFVFNEDEWCILDKELDVDLTGALREIWDECVELSKRTCNNNWAKEELSKYDSNFKGDYGEFGEKMYLPYSDIVNANIEVALR